MKLQTNRYELINETWKLVSSKEEAYTIQKWNDYIVHKDTLKFFRGLGGIETVNGYTSTSISPDGLKKTIRKLV